MMIFLEDLGEGGGSVLIKYKTGFVLILLLKTSKDHKSSQESRYS